MYCVGVVAGASVALTANCKYSKAEWRHKIPTSVGPPTWGAGVQAFVNWARANPQKWGIPGELGVMYALAGAFPCSQ